MKNKTDKIIGFVLGVGGFLMMFKLLFLINIPPEDELAPGIVVFAAVLNVFLFAVIGSGIQNCIVAHSKPK